MIHINESEWIYTTSRSAHVCGVIPSHDFTACHPSAGTPRLPRPSPLFLWWLCGGTGRGTVCLWPTAVSHILHLAPTVKKPSHPVGNGRMVPVQRAGWSLLVTFECCLGESNHCLHLLTTCFTAGDEPMECFPGKKLLVLFFRECFHSLWS